jgi:threonine dehydratase
MRIPTIVDMLRAHRIIGAHLPPTPMWSYPALDATTGAHLMVKHENTQPTGAFKVRGGLTLVAGLDAADRERGLVTYSTGNHARSLAYACEAAGVACTVVMPVGTDPARVAAVRAHGAGVTPHGETFDETAARAGELAGPGGPRLVSPGDEAALVAGVGTLHLEILRQEPELDTIVVPVGSGTSAAAACLVAAALAPRCEVIGVQSAAAPAAHDSWRAGRPITRPNRTRVAGLSTGGPFALPQSILRRHLGDFLLVDDDEITRAQAVLLRDAHTLAEGAGAAALAAVLAWPERFAGRRVAVVCSGGNADAGELAGAVRAWSGAVPAGQVARA